jgi:hypothetical protein
MTGPEAKIFPLANVETFKSAPATPRGPCLSIEEWCSRSIAEPDFLLGELFSTTTRAEIVAETGIGKTNVELAMAFGMADGTGFLHWRGARSAKVL